MEFSTGVEAVQNTALLQELNLAMKDALWGGCPQLAKRAPGA